MSVLDMKPSRMRWSFTPAWVQRTRSIKSAAPISRLKRAVGTLSARQACSAMFVAKALLPMDGRAAMMMSCEGFNPLVMRSKSWKPVAMPMGLPRFL